VNIKLENKENDLVFLSQFDSKSNSADECWRCTTANAEKLWKVDYYLANLMLLDTKETRNN
jgi:hypothetical protein